MNVSVSKWKKSGNGKGNLKDIGSDGKCSVSLILLGTDYTDIKDDEEIDVHYIDDDRFDFCGNSIPTGYFWCMAEMHDLVGIVSQSCSEIGLDISNVKMTTSMKVSPKQSTNRNPNKRNKEDMSEQHELFKEMKTMVKNSEKEMRKNELNALYALFRYTQSFHAEA